MPLISSRLITLELPPLSKRDVAQYRKCLAAVRKARAELDKANTRLAALNNRLNRQYLP